MARFFDGLRQVNGVIAGLTGMGFRRFLALNAIGVAIWAGLWSGLGLLAGQHLPQIYRQVIRFQLCLLVAALTVVVFIGARMAIRHRRASQKIPPPP